MSKEFGYNMHLAWPVMLSQLGQVTVNFVDNVMIGRLGSVPLGAVSLANSVFVIFLVFGLGLSFGLTPLVAKADGAGQRGSIKNLFLASLVINLSFAIISVAAIFLLSPLMSQMNQPPEVVPLAQDYLKIVGVSLLPFMLFQSYRTLSEGISFTKLVFVVTLVGNIINVLCNYIFIYGKLGAEPLGTVGAAYGTLIARIVMAIMMLLIFRYWKGVRGYLVDLKMRIERTLIRKILDLGFPTALSLLFEVSAFAASTFIIGTLGKDQLAAHQIALNLASFTFLLVSGFATVSTIRVSNKMGQNNPYEARKVGFSTMLQAGIFMVVASMIFILFRNILPAIYIDDIDIISIAGKLLVIAALFQIVDGLQVTAMGALRGLHEVLRPTLITFVSYWLIALPLGYYLGIHRGMEGEGVWIGLWIGLSVAAVLLIFRFYLISSHQSSRIE